MNLKVYTQKSQTLNSLYIFISVKYEHNITLILNDKNIKYKFLYNILIYL